MSPTSGSGTGTPITTPTVISGAGSGGSTIIVAEYASLISECSAVKLARYAHLVGYDENPFWGIAHNLSDNQCRYIWSLADRMMVAKYLCEAQKEIEAELGYLIGYQWTIEEKRPYRCPTFANYGHVIALGIETHSAILTSAAVNHATDPAVIGPIATSVTDISEIAVFHPGTEIEIIPSSVIISGGMLTIEIPRCRMIKVDYINNLDVGLDYADVATWGETTVDVVRRYNDQTTQVILSNNHSCSAVCSATGCSAYTQTACGYVKYPGIGAIEVFPADYIDGAWIRRSCRCSDYEEMQLNYLSGVPITHQLEDMIVRLAHAKMPKEPCGCDPLRNLWERDSKIPDTITRERINCTFGTSDGAWTAWRWAQSLKLRRGGIVA